MYESKGLKSFLSCFFTVIFLLSALTLSSFADSGNLIDSDLTQWTEFSSAPDFIESSSGKYRVVFSGQTIDDAFVYYDISNDYSINDTFNLSFDVWGHFERVNCIVGVMFNEDITTLKQLGKIYADFASSNNEYTTFSTNFVPANLYDEGISSMSIVLIFQIKNSSQTNLYFTNMLLKNTSDKSGFWSELWQWLQQLKDKLSNLGTALNVVKNALTDKLESVKTGITTAINNIQQWFVDLGQSIGDFFTMLKNYVLYFQHPVTLNQDGVPVDPNGNPIYENIFDIPDFFETLEGWVENLDNSKADVNSGANEGIAKLNLVKNYMNSLTAIPIISLLITFGLVCIVIKKVLG